MKLLGFWPARQGVTVGNSVMPVYTVVTGQPPPAQPPPLGEMVRHIAALGGYLGRKGDGPPGPKASGPGHK